MNTIACQTRKTRHDCQTRKTRHDCRTQRRCGYALGHLERLPRFYEPLTRPHGEPCPLGRWDHRQLKSACR